MTFHSGPVLSLAITANGEQCFSGGIDSTIQWWNIPSSNIDPYDTYGETTCICCLSHATFTFFQIFFLLNILYGIVLCCADFLLVITLYGQKYVHLAIHLGLLQPGATKSGTQNCLCMLSHQDFLIFPSSFSPDLRVHLSMTISGP